MKNYDIAQDLKTGNKLTETPTFKQYDEGQMITISLTDGGQPVDLKDVSVIVFFRLANGSIEQKKCTVGNNKIFVVLGGNLLLHTGYVQSEFKLYKENAVTTFEISYRVTSSINHSISGGIIETVEPEGKKYAILAVAGQSNSVGYDESAVNPIFDAPDSRIKQLGYYGDNNLKVIELAHHAENLQDMSKHGVKKEGTKGIHLPLAKLILKHIPEDYELLVIPVAYGGTGFTTNKGNGSFNEAELKPNIQSNTDTHTWSENSAYYQTLVKRLERVFSWNEANYYLGMVWCQGEFDYGKHDAHYAAFDKMTQEFFKYFNQKHGDRVKGGTWDKSQWYVHDTVPCWKSGDKNATEIFKKYEEWCKEKNTFVSLNFGLNSDLYTNKSNGAPATGRVEDGSTTSSQETHFGNNAFTTLVAPAVYKKMLENNLFNY